MPNRREKFYTERSVMVTGASGFIGAHLSRRLAGGGARVHGVSRSEPRVPLPGVQWHSGDLGDERFARKVFRQARPEVVFHLASHVAGSREMDLVLPTLHGNLVTTVNVLREVAELACHRVVLAGSMEEPDSEEPGSAPTSPYAAAKWAANGYGRMFHALYGTPVALARIFMVFGPGQWDSRKLIPYVIRSFLAGESPDLSSGVRPVDWVYVDDVVDGLLDMGAGKGPLAVPVELGSGTLATVRSVVEEIERLMGVEGMASFGAVPERPLEQIRKADSEATHRALGWRAQVTLRTGLERTIEWYRTR